MTDKYDHYLPERDVLPPVSESMKVVRSALHNLNRQRLELRVERDMLAKMLTELVGVLDDWGVDEDNREVADAMYAAQAALASFNPEAEEAELQNQLWAHQAQEDDIDG